ncbi:MAG TPA: phosphoribosylformylglycinamidine cyclo-ligase [Clostridiaceae bacterium]|nr:phosphoribosylformylglycinamidine cyclo-ligase [Clostridiaceae bacterium]
MSLTYKESGVDKEAGYQQVKLIKNLVKQTFDENVISDLGGFGGMYRLPGLNYEKPILVSGTDGVGTKLDLAFRADKHDTIGIDCVAMCANDVLCQGAKPLFFLDYIATGKLIPEKMASVVSGVVEGCKQAGMALIGGETAEMPGIYQENHYDLAGFAVGIVDEKDVLNPQNVKIGDQLIGLRSSGVHSNGFSLIRKIVFELQNFKIDTYIDQLGKTLGEELLIPTKIYFKEIMPLLEKYDIHALSHITGGGVIENLPRSLNEGQAVYWDLEDYEIPTIFQLLAEWGNVSRREMFGTFNMGIGMVIIVSAEEAENVIAELKSQNIEHVLMGEVISGNGEVDLRNLQE